MKPEIPPPNQFSPISNLIPDILAMIFDHSGSTNTRQLLNLRHVSKHWSMISRLPQVWINSYWNCQIKLEYEGASGPNNEIRQQNIQALQDYWTRLVQTMPYLRRIRMDESFCRIPPGPGDVNWKLDLGTPLSLSRLQEIQVDSHYSEHLISLIQHLPLLDTLIMKNGGYECLSPLSIEAENCLALLSLKFLSTDNIEWLSFFKRFHSSPLASHLMTLDLMSERFHDHGNTNRAIKTIELTKMEVASFTKLTQLSLTMTSGVDHSQLAVLSMVSQLMKSTVMGINMNEEELDKFKASHSSFLYIDIPQCHIDTPEPEDIDTPEPEDIHDPVTVNWPVIKRVFSTCTNINQVYSDLIDLSHDCVEAYALMKSRGTPLSPSTVNGDQFKDSICSLCHEMVLPLHTCPACKVTACGPCLKILSGRRHFICQSDAHRPTGIISCYPQGPCDGHVDFSCQDCIGHYWGDSSPRQCGVCGGLACWLHFYEACEHTPDMDWQCSNCRCLKCEDD